MMDIFLKKLSDSKIVYLSQKYSIKIELNNNKNFEQKFYNKVSIYEN